MRRIERIVGLMFYFFVISSLIIPISVINKLFFVGIIMLFTLQFLLKKNSKIISLAPVGILLIYLYGYIKAYSSDSDLDLAFQFMIFSVMLFLIYPISENKIDFNKVIMISGLFLTFATFLLYILMVYKVEFIGSNTLIKLFKEYGSISMGYRGFFGDPTLFVHFGSAPFLFLPGCLFFKKAIDNKSLKDYVILCLIILAMVLSSSRALILGFILAALLLVFNKLKGYSKVFGTYFLLIIIAVMFVYLGVNSSVFDLNDFSNNIKVGDAKSFFENIDVGNFVLGDGLAAYFYAGGRGSYSAHTENTLFDTLRYFGFIFTTMLYIFILFPTTNFSKIARSSDAVIIFSIYLAMSLTNPILFNSLGGLIIIWYWSNILKGPRAIF